MPSGPKQPSQAGNSEPSAPAERPEPPTRRGRVHYGRRYEYWADCVIQETNASGARLLIPAIYPLSESVVFLNLDSGVASEGRLRWRRRDVALVSYSSTRNLLDGDDAQFNEIRKAWAALSPRQLGQP